MLKKHFLFSLTYSVVIGLNLFGEALNNEILKLISMPLIGISNILYLLIMTRLRGSFNLKIFLSLMFAMGGDILLIFDTDNEFFFFTAIIATFTGYLMAMSAFYQDTNKEILKSKNVIFYTSILSITVSTVYFMFLRSHLGDLKIPVLIHFFILSLLPITASFRYNSVNSTSFSFILASAICFLISDYSIAYSSFINENTFFMVLYILAYMLAQYMLVIGTIERKTLTSK